MISIEQEYISLKSVQSCIGQNRKDLISKFNLISSDVSVAVCTKALVLMWFIRCLVLLPFFVFSRSVL